MYFYSNCHIELDSLLTAMKVSSLSDLKPIDESVTLDQIREEGACLCFQLENQLDEDKTLGLRALASILFVPTTECKGLSVDRILKTCTSATKTYEGFGILEDSVLSQHTVVLYRIKNEKID